MRRPRHIPQRSCVACRQVRPKAELLRVVRTPTGEIQVDVAGKVAGRGAYVCRRSECVEQALGQKKLGRALGVRVSEQVAEAIRAQAGETERGAAATRSDER